MLEPPSVIPTTEGKIRGWAFGARAKPEPTSDPPEPLGRVARQRPSRPLQRGAQAKASDELASEPGRSRVHAFPRRSGRQQHGRRVRHGGALFVWIGHRNPILTMERSPVWISHRHGYPRHLKRRSVPCTPEAHAGAALGFQETVDRSRGRPQAVCEKGPLPKE